MDGESELVKAQTRLSAMRLVDVLSRYAVAPLDIAWPYRMADNDYGIGAKDITDNIGDNISAKVTGRYFLKIFAFTIALVISSDFLKDQFEKRIAS